MPNPYKTNLGFSPLTNTIYIAALREVPGGQQCHPSKPKTDVTNAAAQFTWMLVQALGGQIEWTHSNGGKMILRSELVREGE